MAGFLLGVKVNRLRGTHRGVFVPEWAHAAVGEGRGETYREMYRHLSGRWVDNGCFAHAIALYAHDQEALGAWFHTSFGMVCGDAVRQLTPLAYRASPGVEVRQAGAEDMDVILPLSEEHQRYYPAPPLFMPLLSLDDRAYWEEWLADSRHAFWLATLNRQPVGFFLSGPASKDASSIIDDPGTASITGAFVRPEARAAGIGKALLARVIDWARENGYARLAVDYETHNIDGSRFWLRHFTEVSCSVIRRVDETIAWANQNRPATSIW
jgi:GNAT superfamily N-acetyltransferase